jgi:hypothetical protein
VCHWDQAATSWWLTATCWMPSTSWAPGYTAGRNSGALSRRKVCSATRSPFQIIAGAEATCFNRFAAVGHRRTAAKGDATTLVVRGGPRVAPLFTWARIAGQQAFPIIRQALHRFRGRLAVTRVRWRPQRRARGRRVGLRHGIEACPCCHLGRLWHGIGPRRDPLVPASRLRRRRVLLTSSRPDAHVAIGHGPAPRLAPTGAAVSPPRPPGCLRLPLAAPDRLHDPPASREGPDPDQPRGRGPFKSRLHIEASRPHRADLEGSHPTRLPGLIPERPRRLQANP